MSDNISFPFDPSDTIPSDDPFAPGAVDDATTTYQTPTAPHDDSARLVAALSGAYDLPPDAVAVLERVRRRVLRVAEAAEAPHAGSDSDSARRETESPDGRSAPPAIPSSTRLSRRFNGWIAALAAVLVVALFAGSFVALLHFHTPSGTGINGTSAWRDVSILKAHTTQPLNFDPANGIAYAVSDASGVIYACGSNKLWYSQDGGKTYQPFRLTLPKPDLQNPDTNCDIATVSGEPGLFAAARVDGQTQALYATPQDSHWKTLQPAPTIYTTANPELQAQAQVQTDSYWQAVLGACSCGFGPQALAVGKWLFLLVQTNQAPILVGTQDFGRTWIWLDEPLAARQMTCNQFAVDPSNPAHLFCGTQPPMTVASPSGPTQFTQVWQTKNGGKTWTNMPYKSGTYLTGLMASTHDVFAVTLNDASQPVLLRQPLSGGTWQQVAAFPSSNLPGNDTSFLLDALETDHVSVNGTVYIWQTAPANSSDRTSSHVTISISALSPGASAFTQLGATTLTLTDQKVGVSGEIVSQTGRPEVESSGIGPGASGRVPLLYLHDQREAAPGAPLYQVALPSA